MELLVEDDEQLFNNLVENLRIQCRIVIKKLLECDKSVTSRNGTMVAMGEMLLSFARKIPRKHDPELTLGLLTIDRLLEVRTAVNNVKKYLTNIIKVHHKTREEMSEATGLYRLFADFYLDCRGAYTTMRPVYSPEDEFVCMQEEIRIPPMIRKKVKKIKQLYRRLIHKTAGWNRVVRLLEERVRYMDKLDDYYKITPSTAIHYNMDGESTLSLIN